MNVNKVLIKDYENKPNWKVRKNKANTKPNKANFRKAQMNVNSLITKDYRKNDAFAVQKNKPNSNPIQTQSKPISNDEEKWCAVHTLHFEIRSRKQTGSPTTTFGDRGNKFEV